MLTFPVKPPPRKVFFCAALFGAAFLSSCIKAPSYVQIRGSADLAPEIAFLESFFGEAGEHEELGLRLLPEKSAGEEAAGGKKRPDILIEVLSSLESEAAFGDILVSRKVLVPADDVLAGRTDTTLAACLDGTETLIPPEEVAPPFAALRVDGLALGDDGYPLVRAAGVRILPADDKKSGKALPGKISRLEEALRNFPKPLVRDLPPPLWIAAAGDMMLDRGASGLLLREGPAAVFGKTAEMLASSGLALVNLEGVLSGRGEKVKKSFNFRFTPEIAPALRAAGIDAVLHANNHVFDYGKDAFLDSLSWLGRAGIGVAGAGADDDAASSPLVYHPGGESVRIFGLASFPRERNGWDGVSAAAGPKLAGMLHTGKGGGEKLKERLAVGGEDTLDIVLFHGGVEWSTRPDSSTRELYTALVEAGADLVIGSHPHIVQGFEWVKGKPVFWSLGNYVFGGMENTEGGEEGLFVRLGFWNGRLLYLEPFALALSHIRTDIAPPEKLDTFYARSRELRDESRQGGYSG